MKKSFLFVVLFLIGISIFDAKAACPAGYQQGSINFIYRTYTDYPETNFPVTCSIQLSYCYYCGMTGMGFNIYINSFTKDCDVAINPDFWQQAETAMLNDLLNESTCIAPCDWNGTTIHTATFSYVTCWNKIHYDGTPINQVTYEICDETATCNYVYKVCVEFINGVATIKKDLDSQFPWQGETCFLYGEPDNQPIPGYWETGCFMFTSDCPYE